MKFLYRVYPLLAVDFLPHFRQSPSAWNLATKFNHSIIIARKCFAGAAIWGWCLRACDYTLAIRTGLEPVASTVTGWRDTLLHQRTIDATYTESPTANYRMNTTDATRNSRKNDGNGGKKEKGLKVSQLATDFITNTAIVLLSRHKTSKSALKG